MSTDKFLLVGDPHGDFDGLRKLAKDNEFQKIISLGDTGFSKDLTYSDFYNETYIDSVFGNHDEYNAYFGESGKLGSYYRVMWFNNKRLFILGGAKTPVEHRDKTWDSREEMSYDELYKTYEIFLNLQPSILVTHDGPISLIRRHFSPTYDSLTSVFVEMMVNHSFVERHFFGHWHRNFASGKSICLDKMQTMEI